jgi:hypothetical protein
MTHRVALAEGWSLWRWFVLRAPGFPAAKLAQLTSTAPDVAVERLLELDRRIADERARAIAALEVEIERRTGDERKPFGRALRKLRAAQPLALTAELAGALQAVERIAALDTERAAMLAEVDATIAAEQARVSRELRALAAEPRFREACTWQNRSAVHTAIDRVRDARVSSPNQHRQHEQLVARYLQRYCVKNDTIGFFGPVCWGTFGTGGHITPGPELLSRRTVYFEHWGIEELAAQLANDVDLLAEIEPRRVPTIRIEGDVLVHGLGARTTLPAPVAALLAACDGTRTASQIAHALSTGAKPAFEDEEEVLSSLAELAERKLVIWTLEIPTAVPFPERALREVIERIAAPARSSAIAKLDRLDQLRDALHDAAGDATRLERALDNLDREFVEITGREATRNPGQVYGGRTLAYEDCRRDLDIELGPAFVASFAPALAHVMRSARWYTRSVADRIAVELERGYDTLCAETGETVIEYPRYFDRIAGVFPSEEGAGNDVVEEVVAELRRRWASVLAFDDTDRRVHRDTASIREAIAEAFPDCTPGWPVARFHSPDLMIVARSVEEVMAGTCTVVLGEVHTGKATVCQGLFLKESPFVEEILAGEPEDVRVFPRIRPVTPKSGQRRPECGPTIDYTFEVESGLARSRLPRDRVLAAADLVVRRRDGRLEIGTRDDRVWVPVMVFFETLLHVATRTRFDPFGARRHLPRITIDNLVIARERWRFAPEEVVFAHRERGADQFVAARRWTAEHGIPRHVFFKVSQELKPIYIDLVSPLYVELASKLVRQSTSVAITEMLPTMDDLWLPDSDGNLYTCELRVTAVDPHPWSV